MINQTAIKLGDEFTGTLPGMRRTILALIILVNICTFYLLFVSPMMLSWSFGSRRALLLFSSFSLWFDIIATIIVCGFFILYLVTKRPKRRLDRNHLYLAALQHPDDTTIPIHSTTLPSIPMLLTPDERRSLASTIQWQMMAPERIKVISDLSCRSLAVVSSATLMSILTVSSATQYRHPNAAFLFMSANIVLLLLSSIMLPIIEKIGSRRFTTAVAVDGIWIRPLRWQHIPWSHIRTIGILSPHHVAGNSIVPRSVCIIAATNGLLMWRIPHKNYTDALHDTKALISLTMQSTGLPLRDLTALTQFKDSSVVQDTDYIRLMKSKEHLLAQSRSKQPFYAWNLVAVMLSVILLFPMTHLMYDVLQPTYLATLPPLIHKRPPILSYPSLSASTISLPSNRTNTYTIGGTRYGNYSLFPTNHGNVAIEALVTVQGSGSGGVASHVTEADFLPQACQLSITANQDWSATCSYATFDTIQGHSPAIHTGSNKLLLIAHGVGYALYINDTYVGFMEDHYGIGAGLTGQVGLYCVGSDTTCTFSTVSVWLLSDNYSLSWL